MNRVIGLTVACILVLVPALAFAGAFLGDFITPNDVDGSDLTEEQLGNWGTIAKAVFILKHIFPAPLLLGTVILALLNWHEGYAIWTPWICLMLGCICGLFIPHPIGILVAGLTLIIMLCAISSSLLAPWK